jgi:hypothetical protein
MTKRAKWILAAAFAVAVVGEVQAQRGGAGGGGQRQPGQQGRGGFGQQQSLYVIMLTNADLQKELKITDDQKKALKDVTTKAEELAKERAAAFGGGGGGGDRQAMQEKTTKLAEEAKATAEKALTDDQKKRIKQIDVQRMGLAAFTNEDVIKGLKITDDQKAKLKTVSDDTQKQIAALRTELGLGGRGAGGGAAGARPDPEKMAEFQKKSAKMTEDAMAKATKELTNDQQKAWKEMVGEAFDVSKLTARPMRRDN